MELNSQPVLCYYQLVCSFLFGGDVKNVGGLGRLGVYGSVWFLL